jgi:hypothetical protein
MRSPINHGALPVPHACRTPAAERFVTAKDANRPARTEQLFRVDDKMQMRGASRRTDGSAMPDGAVMKFASRLATREVRSLSRLRGRAGVGVSPQRDNPPEERTPTRRFAPTSPASGRGFTEFVAAEAFNRGTCRVSSGAIRTFGTFVHRPKQKSPVQDGALETLRSSGLT